MALQGGSMVLCLAVYLIHVCLFLCLFSHRTCFVDSALKSPVADNVTSSPIRAKTFSFATSPRPHSHRAKGDYMKNTEQVPIIFPADDSEDLEVRGSIKPSKRSELNLIKKCAKDSTICDQVDGYPTEQLTKILTRSIGKSFQATVDVEGHTVLIPHNHHHRTHINDLSGEPGDLSGEPGIGFRFHSQFKPSPKSSGKSNRPTPGSAQVLSFAVDKLDGPTGITNRLGSVDEFLCQSTPKIIFPQYGETRDGVWKFIVNVNNFNQGVLVDVCSQKHKACNHAEHFPPNLSTKCVQKYMYRKLVAFDSKTETLDNDNFRIPSCCLCAVTQHSSVDDGTARRNGDVPEPLALSMGGV